MTFPFWTGGQAILWGGRSTPDAMFEHIERFKPTIYFGVPTLFATQLQMLANTSPNLSSLRICVSAGEPLPANIFERWEARTSLQILDGHRHHGKPAHLHQQPARRCKDRRQRQDRPRLRGQNHR